jgi:hypothetical protein
MNITDYAKAKHAQQVIALFQKIYPEWDQTALEKMAYDESHPGHLKTKLAVESGVLVGQVNAFWIDRKKRIANLGYQKIPEPYFKALSVGKNSNA